MICFQFPFGSLRSTTLVPSKNQLQRKMFYDTRHKGHLQMDVIGLH
jgi:hypothetical protein